MFLRCGVSFMITRERNNFIILGEKSEFHQKLSGSSDPASV